MKRLLSMICALALVLGMVIPTASHVHAVTDTTCDCGATNVEWTTLTDDTVLEPGEHYRLEADRTKSIELQKPENIGTYCLDLAGHSISRNNRSIVLGKNDGSVAITLNIMDSSANQSGRVEGAWGNTSYSAGVVYVYKGTTMNIYGGTFTTTDNAEVVAKNGGVFQVSGEVNMYGGSIIGGTVAGSGGAVSVSGTFNMSAGTIIGGTAAKNGGAVNVDGTFNMSGGSISGGTAGSGNCVYASSGSKIELSRDASIEEIYFGSTPASCLTVSGVYTGTVALNAATAITSGTTVAVSDNADISGATITIAGDADLRPSVSDSSIVVGKVFWCEACQDYFTWKNLDDTLPNEAGHYKLAKNVSAGHVTLDAIGGKICIDLAGYTYTAGGRGFLLKDVSGDTSKDTVNIMDSSDGNTGAMRAKGGSDGHAGGIFRTYSNTILNVYDANLEYLTQDEIKTKHGAVAVVEGIMNVYGNSKLVGGKVATTGGAIDVLKAGTLNMYGGEITGGEAGTVGDCVHVTIGGTVNLSGNASVKEIYFAGSSAEKLTISGTYTGKATLKFATVPAADADIGNCENAVIGKESIAISGTRLFAAVSGTNLSPVTLQGASVTNGSNVTYYDTLAQAVAGYTAGTVKLLADNSETVNLPSNMTLDLNGWDLSGSVTVSGGKVYVKDTATDDYNVDDVAGYGTIPAAIKDAVEPVEHYLELTEDTGVSFHRYVLKLSKVNLRPSVTGLYYTADVKLSSAVLNKIDSYGIAVSTGSKNPALEDAKTLYTAISAEDYSAAGTNSVLINAVMDPAAKAADNTVYATTVIYGRPYIKFKDGAIAPFYGDVCATSLQQLTEAVEQVAWDRLSLPQSRGLTAMYDAYKEVTATWNLPSVEKANTAADDKDLKVLVIGNSHGLDSTNLLYEVFKNEGLPEEYEHVTLGAIYTGGCSVSSHAKKALGDLTYEYWVKNVGSTEDGSWLHYEDPTMREVLEDEDWDVVLLQEMNTVSAVASNFENNNIQTVFTFVVNTLGYEPKFMWNMIWANPEIPESYMNYITSLENGSSDGQIEDAPEDADNNQSVEKREAQKRAWIFETQGPTKYITWGKNYKNWENNRQVMYNHIVSNVHNYVVGKEVHNIGMDDVMPNATAIQYAIEWMGMHEQDMYRDYTHVSDLGRLTVAYLWYAKLTGKTSIEAPKYTLVSQVLENARQPLGYARDWSAYSDVIKESVNFALADHYGVIQNYTYAEYLALTAEEQAAYEASFESFSVNSGWTYEEWLTQAVAGVTYTDYIRMTEEQKTAFRALCADFDTWYNGVVEDLRYVEYFLLTAEEQAAYSELREADFETWFAEASNAFTYTDYVMLTYDQQEAYKATFSETADFTNLFNSWKEDLTYQEYMGLTMHQKLQYRKTYSSIANFLVWYEAAKAAAES